MNRLKAALQQNALQIGLWQSLANPYAAEICAAAGFDWLLFDGEHSPNTVPTLLAQLQAVAAYPVEAVARPPVGDPVLIKQYLDIGFRSLLIPMVGSVEQARLMVAATRFPPEGIRGVASATRGGSFGGRPDYLQRAHEDICLILQIESKAGLDAVEAIAAVEGVDALFIGPSDLAAALGHLGDPAHFDVQNAIATVLGATRKAGKPVGIYAASPEAAKHYAAKGASMISIGSDTGLLLKGAKALRQAMTA